MFRNADCLQLQNKVSGYYNYPTSPIAHQQPVLKSDHCFNAKCLIFRADKQLKVLISKYSHFLEIKVWNVFSWAQKKEICKNRWNHSCLWTRIGWQFSHSSAKDFQKGQFHQDEKRFSYLFTSQLANCFYNTAVKSVMAQETSETTASADSSHLPSILHIWSVLSTSSIGTAQPFHWINEILPDPSSFYTEDQSAENVWGFLL